MKEMGEGYWHAQHQEKNERRLVPQGTLRFNW